MTSIAEEHGNKAQELGELPDKAKEHIDKAEHHWLVKLLHLAGLVKTPGEQLLEELNKAIGLAEKELKGVDLSKDLPPLMGAWGEIHAALNEAHETVSGRSMKSVNEHRGNIILSGSCHRKVNVRLFIDKL